MKHSKNPDYLAAFISKMQSAGLPSPVIDTFAYYYHQVIKGETGLVYGRDIRPLEKDEIEQFQNLGNYAAAGIERFHQTVRIVLNGGLGTSMGLTAAKSLIEISFLNRRKTTQ
jgi:UTP--glucose-1-phosphate uridylyltransferase